MNDTIVLTPITNGSDRIACCIAPDGLRLGQAEVERLAGMFKAIGHPVRLQIVDLLIRYQGQACVCDIEGMFDLAQPTISHHLKVLRKAGVVESERRGQWYYYFVTPRARQELRQWVDSMFAG